MQTQCQANLVSRKSEMVGQAVHGLRMHDVRRLITAMSNLFGQAIEGIAMSSTTNFDVWLEENEPDGHEEIYSLYQAVDLREGYGLWDVTTQGDKTFIKGTTSTLQLLSEKARLAFLTAVEKLKDDPEMDMESWYGFERNMANPKA